MWLDLGAHLFHNPAIVHLEVQVTLLQKLQAISTAMSEILTKTAQVETALTALNAFLDSV